LAPAPKQPASPNFSSTTAPGSGTMAIQKRKAVVRAAGKRSAAAAGKAAKAAKQQLAKQEEVERETEEPENEQEEGVEKEDSASSSSSSSSEEEVSEEDRIKQEESELQTARKKELKGMYIDALKEVAASKGVEPCKKDDMIAAVVASEAKDRDNARAQKAKLRAVVVEKKEALESMPLPDLREVCNEYGIKGKLTKQARIEQVMKLWQEADGVDKALAKRARDERAASLDGMDKAILQKLCEKAGVEPFVKEVMVERLVRVEGAAGKFARPTIPAEPAEEEQKPKKAKKTDMVDALLEQEANRKREAELKKQQEQAEASKRKELKALSVDELKKTLTKKGRDATGKKEDMVEALYQITLQEEAAAAHKAKFRALSLDDLKKLVTSRGLSVGKKDSMIDAVLDHEARSVEAVKAYEAKIEEALAKVKGEFEAKTAAELKDMCAAKNLKLGSGKEMRIDILVADAKASGALGKVVAALAMTARTAELLSKEQSEVLKLCEEADVDPIVKPVLVERLLAYEAEFGCVELDEAPKAKRARRR